MSTLQIDGCQFPKGHNLSKARIKWIDVAKAFGIFAIYFSHCGIPGGGGVTYFFTHHVPLFFFLSGCTERMSHKTSFPMFIRRLAKRLLLPWAIYGVVSILFHSIIYSCEEDDIIKLLKLLVLGTVRNTFVAGGLWFITCLFCIKVLFFWIKQLKEKWLVFFFCLVFSISVSILCSLPSNPQWVFNLDSALYYIVFFALGYLLFPMIDKMLSSKTTISLCIVSVTTIGALIYSSAVFWGWMPFACVLSWYKFPRIISSVLELIEVIPLIWPYLVLGKVLDNIEILCKLGEESLFLCLGEYISSVIIWYLVTCIGLTIQLTTPFSVCVYCCVLLLAEYKWIVPIGKKITLL